MRPLKSQHTVRSSRFRPFKLHMRLTRNGGTGHISTMHNSHDAQQPHHYNNVEPLGYPLCLRVWFSSAAPSPAHSLNHLNMTSRIADKSIADKLNCRENEFNNLVLYN